MADRAHPLNGTIYRVVNLGTATIVEDGIHDDAEARERLSREFARVPRGRFAVEVRTSPGGEWLLVGTVGGFARSPDWPPTRPEEGTVTVDKVDKSSELFVGHRGANLIIEVYRIPGRSDLRKCRARAKVIAAREGIHTEPDVASFNDFVPGDTRDPQGWTFTFDEEGHPN
jgi:hypothetical protein